MHSKGNGFHTVGQSFKDCTSLALSQQQGLRKLAKRYPWANVSMEDFEVLWHLQLADKKNENGEVQCTSNV